MVARRKLNLPQRKRKIRASGGRPSARKYFSGNKGIRFFSSGCQLLDNALGGGYAEGRIINIVGDKSTGKTLQAIEACANFAMTEPKGLIRYKEAEAAFDKGYAQILGMPLDRVEFEEDFDTVEELHKDLEKFTARCKKAKQPGLYILDSLDALSDKAELERDMDKGSYNLAKPKLMSEMFRREKRKWQRARVTVIIISQVRDKINATFGRRWTRSGGKALDFYASQVMYLAEVRKLNKTVRGIMRPYGVIIKCKITKNKVGIPFREVEYSLIFAYGIDDILASLEWLKKIKRMKRVGLLQGSKPKEETKKIKAMPSARRKIKVDKISKVVLEEWISLEEDFLPTESKY